MRTGSLRASVTGSATPVPEATLYDDDPYLTPAYPPAHPTVYTSHPSVPLERYDLDRYDADRHDLDRRDLDRLTHLVLVDGRLVEVWSEPVTGTRWQEHADRFDRELRRPAPEPTPPVHERALAWLDGVSGSREATLALDAAPLVDDGRDLPEAPSRQAQSRLAAVAELLDAVGQQCFDAETTWALRAALLAVWDREPEVVLDAASAAHVAGGICWAVGKANGLYRPHGRCTMGRVKEALALHATISTYGKVVERALVGYRDLGASGWWRPAELPDLLPLGHPDLLLGEVRARLLRVRQRALEARDLSAA